MAKVLILINFPGEKLRDENPFVDRSYCGRGGSEWEACWWENRFILNDIKNRNIFVAKLYPKKNDQIKLLKGGIKEGIEFECKENLIGCSEEEGATFMLFKDTEEAFEVLSKSCKSIVDNEGFAWIVAKKNDKYIKDISSFLEEMGHEVLMCEHKPGTEYVRYSSSESYWNDLMKLRYNSINIDKKKSRKDAFMNVWKSLKSKTDKSRIRNMKHDIINIFVTIKTDIEGWRDCGFDESVIKDIKKSSEETYSMNTYLRAKKILYKEYGEDERSMEQILKRNLEEGNLSNSEKWREIEELIPREKGEYHKSWRVVKSIYENDIEKAKKLIKSGLSISEWVRKVDEVLNDMIERNV